jgi:hypothetical protein
MGIDELWSHALKGIKQLAPKPLNDARGAIVGVDISVWLHKYIHTNEAALCLSCVPKYPPASLLAKIRNLHSTFINAGIRPYYVFDGFRHLMKKVARTERDNKEKSAKDWLAQFYTDGASGVEIDDQRREAAMSYIRDSCNPDETVVCYVITWMRKQKIDFMCAAFEAEWQLAKMEQDGRIDAVLTSQPSWF